MAASSSPLSRVDAVMEKNEGWGAPGGTLIHTCGLQGSLKWERTEGTKEHGHHPKGNGKRCGRNWIVPERERSMQDCLKLGNILVREEPWGGGHGVGWFAVVEMWPWDGEGAVSASLKWRFCLKDHRLDQSGGGLVPPLGVAIPVCFCYPELWS